LEIFYRLVTSDPLELFGAKKMYCELLRGMMIELKALLKILRKILKYGCRYGQQYIRSLVKNVESEKET